MLAQPFSPLATSPPIILFSLPLTSQSHLSQPFPFSPSADNLVSYVTKIGSNKKRTSSFSIHWSTTMSLPMPLSNYVIANMNVNTAFPPVLPDELYRLLCKPSASSCELAHSAAHTLKDISLQRAGRNHLKTINFQFPLCGLHT